MNNYKVFSFDIFDTLLLRPFADPQEVWRVLEESEKAHGFAKARKKADAVTYRKAIKANGETTIEEAYDLIPRFQYLIQKEMDLERSILHANPEMLKLWNELGIQGKRRVIVSDMYLPADFIKSVLREKGFDGWSGFYLSRDYNVRKSTGKLFEVMLKAEDVEPEEVLHIGDNVVSDVKQPMSLGIHTQQYKKVIDRLYGECPFTRYINGRLSGALAVGWHQYKSEHTDCNYWHRLGFMMGGVLGYIYVKWIVETAKNLGISRLLFIARDGYIWEKICRELYPEFETDYIYAPRITSIAALGAIGRDAWAVADRENYMKNHLQGVNTIKIIEEYRNYIKKYDIDEKTALVDGCSSGFSAQRLVEHSVGHKVFCFYLLAMAPKQYAASLYSTNHYSLPWQMLSEFLFGASEKPIKGIRNDTPVYEDEIPEHELFKINVSSDMACGAVVCAKALYQEKVNVSAKEWLHYVDQFMLNLTEEDKKDLAQAKNAPDVEQKLFVSTMYNKEHGIYVKRGGPRAFIVHIVTNNHCRSFFFNRKGVHYKHKDMTVDIGNIVN